MGVDIGLKLVVEPPIRFNVLGRLERLLVDIPVTGLRGWLPTEIFFTGNAVTVIKESSRDGRPF